MNWDAVGAIGEIIGAIAVVCSLIYLGSQIRHQVSESRITVINSLTQQWNEFMQTLAASPDLYDIFLRFTSDSDSITQEEKGRAASAMFTMTQIAESFYMHHLSGRLDPEMWRAIEVRLRELISTPGARKWWTYRCHWHSDRFHNYVDGLLESNTDNDNYLAMYRDGETPNKSSAPDA